MLQIDEDLIVNLRSYIFTKTYKSYFGRIKSTTDDIMVSCPYHKEGQEQKPSMGIKRHSDDKCLAGTCYCFACKKKSNLYEMLKYILADKFDADEIESKFEIQTTLARESIKRENDIGFEWKPLIRDKRIKNSDIKYYKSYHPYYAKRNITEATVDYYDLGFDKKNQCILFPIRTVMGDCVCFGSRSILEKEYRYPKDIEKPLYGVYELPIIYSHIYVVEGPFNLWSLYQYGKSGVALLGTGTQKQYNELLTLNCKDYVLALDGDSAGRSGTLKLGNFLNRHNKIVYVADVPIGQDINDMTTQQFKNMNILTFNEWKYIYKM